ncbi:MAG: lipoprotein [Acidihalobacter sp.]|jgi:predicted small lipoprotein YifL
MNLTTIGRRVAALLLIALLVSVLGGCGKKGPLYLPGNGSSTQQGG